ncbi:hypothetical protein PR002_g30038 [Phytophthora rubi]|uniref:Uncharacterized protein n=1 Tax=Phytophthora rubi TaxID=129364 RepID=A0A6A3GVU9_9STRA|nr:hypothetical protein PR002_g30038 [Phytophthora rubi]
MSGIGVSPLLCGTSSLTTSGSSFGCCSSSLHHQVHPEFHQFAEADIHLCV